MAMFKTLVISSDTIQPLIGAFLQFLTFAPTTNHSKFVHMRFENWIQITSLLSSGLKSKFATRRLWSGVMVTTWFAWSQWAAMFCSERGGYAMQLTMTPNGKKGHQNTSFVLLNAGLDWQIRHVGYFPGGPAILRGRCALFYCFPPNKDEPTI